MSKKPNATNRRRAAATPIPLNSWFRHHVQCNREAFLRLVRQPVSSALTWLVIAIALMLPSLFYSAFHAINLQTQAWQAGGQVTLYLSDATSEADGLVLAADLNQRPEIEFTQYTSKEQAWQVFQQSLNIDGQTALLDNPLPASIVVVPFQQSDVELEALILMLQSLADVDEIQVDLMWISRLNRLLNLAEHIVQLLGLILAIAVVLIVGNTIRLHIESRKSEILIIKLLGATDGFIRRPFLYLGFWYGSIGGLAAWALLTLVGLSLHPYLRSFLDTYGIETPRLLLNSAQVTLLLLASILVSLIGARIALWRHLRAIEPR